MYFRAAPRQFPARDLLCHLRDLFRRTPNLPVSLALRVDLPGVVRLDDVFRQSGVVIRSGLSVTVKMRSNREMSAGSRSICSPIGSYRRTDRTLGFAAPRRGTPRFQRRVDPRLRDGRSSAVRAPRASQSGPTNPFYPARRLRRFPCQRGRERRLRVTTADRRRSHLYSCGGKTRSR